MKLQEAKELREELEAIEATMLRIKELWLSDDFPCADSFKDLESSVDGIATSMESIIKQAEEMPKDDSFKDLESSVDGIATSMESIIKQAEEMPVAESISR